MGPVPEVYAGPNREQVKLSTIAWEVEPPSVHHKGAAAGGQWILKNHALPEWLGT